MVILSYRSLKIVPVFTLILFFRPQTVFAQAELKLVATDSDARDTYGYSVSIHGGSAIVGSPRHGNVGGDNGPGAAYIYRFNNSWIEEQILTAPDGKNFDNFGISVSINDGLAIVGALTAHQVDGSSGPGAAYIFRFNGSEWIWEDEIVPNDAELGDNVGESVSIYNDVALVGAPDSGSRIGAAYIYRFDGTDWAFEQKLPSPGGSFGQAVALSNNLAIVSGGPALDQAAGKVYIYRFNGIGWHLSKTLEASNREDRDYFGESISYSEKFLVVGAPGRNLVHPTNPLAGANAGAAYIFQYDGLEWNEKQMLTAGDLGTSNKFGISLSVFGDNLVIGSHQAHDNGFQSGNAYLFQYNGAEFVETHKIISSDGNEGDKFGTSVSLYDSTVIIGSPRDGQGSAYLYNLEQLVTAREETVLSVPTEYQLSQNYPNPFNPRTIITYALPRPSDIQLEVYDLLGKRVRVLERGFKPSGEHKVIFEATSLPSGVYFYTLAAGNFTQTRKMVVVK